MLLFPVDLATLNWQRNFQRERVGGSPLIILLKLVSLDG